MGDLQREIALTITVEHREGLIASDEEIASYIEDEYMPMDGQILFIPVNDEENEAQYEIKSTRVGT